MKRLSILLLSVCFGLGLVATFMQLSAVSGAAPSEMVCVKPGGGDGCFASIQAGIDAADFRDTVRVSSGIFTENIVISKYVKVEGGWNSDFTLRDINKFSTTIHSAVDEQSVVTIQGPITSPADDPIPFFDGFFVTGGNLTNEHGGGIVLRNSISMVSNNSVFSNTGYFLGGGIYIVGGSPTLMGNKVFSNVVLPSGPDAFGGGIQIEGGEVMLIDNLIQGNRISATHGAGAGIDIAGGRVTLISNDVISNRASLLGSFGGGVAIRAGSASFSQTVIAGNRAAIGGGIYNTADFSMTDSIVFGNHAEADAGAIYSIMGANSHLQNSLMFSNTSFSVHGIKNYGTMTARNSIFLHTEGENCNLPDGGNGIKTLGHNLENGFSCGFQPAEADFVGKKLQLAASYNLNNEIVMMQGTTSPLIDAGDNKDCPPFDINGAPRPQDGNGDGHAICDMGPIEYVKSGTDAVYVVTTAADEDDGFCAPGDCSLREAIQAANAHPGRDTVRMGAFESGAGLSIEEGQIIISDDLTVFCEDSIPFFATANNDRAFEIAVGAKVTLHGCAVQGGMAINGGGIFVNGGDLTLVDGYIAFNEATERGGGIFVEDGNLTLQNTVVLNNRSGLHGGGIGSLGDSTMTILDGSMIEQNSSDLGGGILTDVGGRLEIKDSVVFSNTAASGAGAYSAGQTELINSVIEKNVASNFGGGIAVQEGVLQILDGTWIRNNRASSGGGIGLLAGTGTVSLKQSTVSANEAFSGGGLVLGSETMIENSSIYSNKAFVIEGQAGSGRGGGIYAFTSDITLVHTTIALNLGGGLFMIGDDGDDGKGGLGPPRFANIKVGNSIIALNSSSTKSMEIADCVFGNNEIEFAQTGPNLSEAETCPGFEVGNTTLNPSGGRSVAKIDPGYLPLLEGSVAIDVGNDRLCAEVGGVDQRNHGRPAGLKCDLGAYEFEATLIPPTSEMPKIFLPLIQAQ